MNLRHLVLVALIICITGCGAKHVAQQNKLDETLTWYEGMLERGDVEATALVAADSIAREYHERARALKEVRIVECRILRVDYGAGADEADVTLEIEYYSLDTLKVKKVRETQKWVYIKTGQSPQWRLMTVPSFLK